MESIEKCRELVQSVYTSADEAEKSATLAMVVERRLRQLCLEQQWTFHLENSVPKSLALTDRAQKFFAWTEKHANAAIKAYEVATAAAAADAAGLSRKAVEMKIEAVLETVKREVEMAADMAMKAFSCQASAKILLSSVVTKGGNFAIGGEFDTKPDERICPVCLEALVEGVKVAITDCGHVFHGQCLGEWLLRQHTCPSCRSSML